MPDIIQLLPDALANQIAAGEVVQRPSSVVKELLENSIDAGATNIHLIVKDAGKQLIHVIDNGKGMSETDARMCFERHATSKLRQTEDLFNIRTLGFRGEAMASIAAVAQVELKTRREEDELGTLLKIEGSEVKQQVSVACDRGTSVCIKNLFFNVPARRNFLKSNAVEMRHILDEFQRIALSHPEVAMSLYQNDMEIFHFGSEKLSHRVVSLFGKNYKEQMIPCQEETDQLKIHGYIGKPENSKKTRGEQFFFANNRFIRHNYLHHAVMNAFEELIGNDSYPFYVIFIEIDPKHIDINVHPTKTEIKFDDEKTVYHIIRAAVKKALATHNIAPSLDFGLNVNFDALAGSEMKLNYSTPEQERSQNSYKYTAEKSNTQNWEQLYKDFNNEVNVEKFKQAEQNNDRSVFSSKLNLDSFTGQGANEGDPVINKEILYHQNPSVFQLHNQYIVSQVKSGMLLIDQQAAHERILYEKYLGTLQNKSGASQQFLFPQSIDLSPIDFTLVMEMEQEIKALGFVFNVFGKNTIVVNGIPADVPTGSEKGLFEGLIEQFKQFKTELRLDRRENLARSLAKRSALKPGTKLTLVEMNTLVDQLFACKTPNYAPNGNLTIILMDLGKIAKYFNKS